MTNGAGIRIRLRTNVEVDFNKFVSVYKALSEAFDENNLGLLLVAYDIREGKEGVWVKLADKAGWLSSIGKCLPDVRSIIIAALQGEGLETTLRPWHQVIDPDYPKTLLATVGLHFPR